MYINKYKSAGAYSLCIGVVFGTAASYFGKYNRKAYVNLMSKYITVSAVSIAALLSLQGFMVPTTQSKQSPLQHLRVLNYQSHSISAIPTTKPSMNIHSRYV
ncbi:uncharacterized protein EV154DRAFT_104857 [Mucor mucedo]|uniref:uncharacterized protein n=1 Tax=Mucor mucedo TaxID=29922 RepID=UPI002220C467|nr:uncharacterized protein EV154DRAFT_104857 [Mucor mucedo]KAI7872610.1 hypothetical protein EV154DRAFT_104857 [Mucor mucedo]